MVECNPKVSAIFVCPEAGLPMESREEVKAIAGKGLEGDRYARGTGAFSQGKKEKIRHVSLISSEAVENTDFSLEETRRNLVVTMAADELNDLIGQEFQIGSVKMRGTEQCRPCVRPSVLTDKPEFKEIFENKGGLRAEILSDGKIKKGDPIQIFTSEKS